MDPSEDFPAAQRSSSAGRIPPRRGLLALRLALEFVTIVAGVLVALAVDQWVRGREDRALERDYLARLEADLRADSLVNAEAFYFLALKDSGLVRLESLWAGEPVDEGEAPNLLRGLFVARVRGMPGARTRTTWDDLRTTGHLALVRDPLIRAALDRYYATIDRSEGILQNDLSDYPRTISRLVPGELQVAAQSGRPLPDGLFGVALARIRAQPDLDRSIDSERGYGVVQRVLLERVAAHGDTALAVLRQAVR